MVEEDETIAKEAVWQSQPHPSLLTLRRVAPPLVRDSVPRFGEGHQNDVGVGPTEPLPEVRVTT